MSEKQKEIAKRLGPRNGEKSPSFGRIRLRNIETNKIINVKPIDVQKYLDTNKWVVGGLKTSKETKQKISKANAGRKMSNQSRQNISNGLRKRYTGKNGKAIKNAISNGLKQLVWITNIKTNKAIRVKKTDLEKYLLSSEWKKGRKNLNFSDYVWMHNIELNTRIRVHKNNSKKIQNLIALGYKYGTGNKHTGPKHGKKYEKMSQSRAGRRKMINEKTKDTRLVNNNDIQKYLDLGYTFTKRSKK